MGHRLAGCLIGMLLLAACAGNPDPLRAPVVSPGGQDPTEDAGGEPGAPNPSAVDVDQFLRPGTSAVAVVRADLSGERPHEIVVHSRSNEPGPDGLAAQEYVDVYTWTADESWEKVFDATTHIGPDGDPILSPDQEINQSVVEPFVAVDFAGDQVPEMVLAVQSSGASPGPLQVWILSWPAESLAAQLVFSTERGGTLTLNPDRTLTLESGEYRPGDPGCCPSEQAVRRIGYDEASGMVTVLSTELSSS
ncbi:MAG TPA: hypothetical protein VM754_09555 [Actinomycetota bacterium]|nr:hypothetical protein [Actinomycetota bacterium]